MLKQCYHQNVLCVVVSRFAKERKGKGLLSSLGLKTPLNSIGLLGNILY